LLSENLAKKSGFGIHVELFWCCKARSAACKNVDKTVKKALVFSWR